MIRKKTGGGFFPRRGGGLVWTLLLAGLPWISAPGAGAGPGEGRAEDPAWWEVRLVVTVNGEYSYRGGAAPISGDFRCRALWEGRLEPEGDDFLLLHLRTELLEWRLREKAGEAGTTTVLEAPGPSAPVLRLRYVLKEGEDVEFDFDLAGVPVPLHAFPVKSSLEMPRSAERDVSPAGQGYGSFITRGSNRLVLPASDLKRRAPERTFQWEWRRERQLSGDSRTFLLTERHVASATVSLAARR